MRDKQGGGGSTDFHLAVVAHCLMIQAMVCLTSGFDKENKHLLHRNVKKEPRRNLTNLNASDRNDGRMTQKNMYAFS